MFAVRSASLVAVLAAFALPAAAQPVAAPEACTYDACALRVEPGFFARRIVAGADGVPVGRIGAFGSDLPDAVGSSGRALAEAQIHEESRGRGLLALVGGAALVVLAVPGGPFGDDDATLAGVLVGGFALTAVGAHLQIRSERALARAVWEFNRDLPR